MEIEGCKRIREGLEEEVRGLGVEIKKVEEEGEKVRGELEGKLGRKGQEVENLGMMCEEMRVRNY